MHIEAHFALGWLLGELGSAGRRFRAVILTAALAPDLDGITYFMGKKFFLQYHHMLTHNLLYSIVISILAVWICKGCRLKALIFSQLAFYTHYVGDYFFTRYPLYFFYPFSGRTFLPLHGFELDHYINLIFIYIAFAILILLAVIYKRTPVDIISPELDRRIVNLVFTRRHLKCHICGRPGSEVCSICGKAACIRHGSINRRFDVCCSSCRTHDNIKQE